MTCNLRPFKLKIGTPLTRAVGTSTPIMTVRYLFVFKFQVQGLGPDYKKILRFLLRLSQVRSQVYRKFSTYDII